MSKVLKIARKALPEDVFEVYKTAYDEKKPHTIRIIADEFFDICSKVDSNMGEDKIKQAKKLYNETMEVVEKWL